MDATLIALLEAYGVTDWLKRVVPARNMEKAQEYYGKKITDCFVMMADKSDHFCATTNHRDSFKTLVFIKVVESTDMEEVLTKLIRE